MNKTNNTKGTDVSITINNTNVNLNTFTKKIDMKKRSLTGDQILQCNDHEKFYNVTKHFLVTGEFENEQNLKNKTYVKTKMCSRFHENYKIKNSNDMGGLNTKINTMQKKENVAILSNFLRKINNYANLNFFSQNSGNLNDHFNSTFNCCNVKFFKINTLNYNLVVKGKCEKKQSIKWLESFKNIKSKVKKFLVFLSGAFIGFINGFWGGGGGMICVPTLSNFYELEEKKAHATAILVMLPLSIISLIVYMLKNDLNYHISLYVAIGSVVGAVLGAFFLKKINNFVLKVIFAFIIIWGGIKMF